MCPRLKQLNNYTRQGTAEAFNLSRIGVALSPVFGGFVLIVGGNCNNGSKCGRYWNLNNTASNANWNIGASQTLIMMLKCNPRSSALAENYRKRRGLVSQKPNGREVIRR